MQDSTYMNIICYDPSSTHIDPLINWCPKAQFFRTRCSLNLNLVQLQSSRNEILIFQFLWALNWYFKSLRGTLKQIDVSNEQVSRSLSNFPVVAGPKKTVPHILFPRVFAGICYHRPFLTGYLQTRNAIHLQVEELGNSDLKYFWRLLIGNRRRDTAADISRYQSLSRLDLIARKSLIWQSSDQMLARNCKFFLFYSHWRKPRINKTFMVLNENSISAKSMRIELQRLFKYDDDQTLVFVYSWSKCIDSKPRPSIQLRKICELGNLYIELTWQKLHIYINKYNI